MQGKERGHKFLEHTADIYIEAWGQGLEEAFEEAAIAMFESITNLDKVEPKEKIEIGLEAENLETLIVDWLNELVYLMDAKGLLLSKFDVTEVRKSDGSYTLKAYVYGEPINIDKHELKIEVKAATYGLMKLTQKGEEVRLKVLLDI